MYLPISLFTSTHKPWSFQNYQEPLTDLYFLPLLATYQCVSTHLLRTAVLEDQTSGETFLAWLGMDQSAWGSCLAWHPCKRLPAFTFRPYLLFFTAATCQVVPKNDTLHLVLHKSQCPLVCTPAPLLPRHK